MNSNYFATRIIIGTNSLPFMAKLRKNCMLATCTIYPVSQQTDVFMK